MSNIQVELDNKRFWEASDTALKAMPLSKRSVVMLEACRSATFAKPALKISHAQAWHLREKGLLDYRMFDPDIGHGGHFITEAGTAALRQHYATSP